MRTALVVGTGLIGTSVGLALRAQGVDVHLFDTDPAALRAATALGAGRPGPPPGRGRPPAADGVDIAVVAVPPDRVAGVLAALQKDGTARAYTDVGAVKLLPRQQALALGCDLSSYIGGHPMAGEGRAGPLAARADLFRRHPWVITPTGATEDAVLNRALELVALCGATPVIADAAEHDRAVALVSHAPLLLAALAAGQLTPDQEFALRLSTQPAYPATGGAEGDTARSAELLTANAEAVADVLERIGDRLRVGITALRTLAAGTGAGTGTSTGAGTRAGPASDRARDEARRAAATDLRQLLATGAAGRARIPPPAATGRAATLGVVVSDRPGELGRLFSDVAAAGVNIDDVRLDHLSAGPGAAVRLTVPAATALHLTDRLREGGWTTLTGPRPPQPSGDGAGRS
ncbi:prephenate dehydrogenase [Kitasatospora sp. NPDC048540]|uniref:prephenate dehydrogenase n=1 Tax=Kitasatospora sp. NPDC048540 TaxID=3155634 RepID=UPI0033E1A428